MGGCGALRRCGCARTYEGTQFLCVKFRLGSAGEPTICSHCYSVPYMKIPANNQVFFAHLATGRGINAKDPSGLDSDRWIPHSRCCENPAPAKALAGFSRHLSAGFTDLNPAPRGLSLYGPGGRLGGRLPNLRNPYLCNRLTDFLHSKFCEIVYSALPNKHTIMLIIFCKIGNAVLLLLGAVW